MHPPYCEPTIAVVDGQPVSVPTMQYALAGVEQRVEGGTGFSLFTLNLDHLVKRREDPFFKAAYERADLVTADGWPVVVLARRRCPSIERTTGADLVLPACRLAARLQKPVFLFGTTAEILASAVHELRTLCPGLIICGAEAPPFDFAPNSDAALEVARRIAHSGASLCFVALGAPKQEIFADHAKRICSSVGFICIGAALDFIAGAQSRAPLWIQQLNLEWAWRLGSSPKRLGLRYLKCGRLFLQLLFLQLFVRAPQRPDLPR